MHFFMTCLHYVTTDSGETATCQGPWDTQLTIPLHGVVNRPPNWPQASSFRVTLLLLLLEKGAIAPTIFLPRVQRPYTTLRSSQQTSFGSYFNWTKSIKCPSLKYRCLSYNLAISHHEIAVAFRET